MREVLVSAQVIEVIAQAIDGAGRDQAFLAEFQLALVVALDLGELGPGLQRLQAQLARIERRQDLPGAHRRALFDVNPFNLATDPRDHVGIRLGLQGRRAGVNRLHLPQRRGHDLDGYGRLYDLVVGGLGRGWRRSVRLGTGRKQQR